MKIGEKLTGGRRDLQHESRRKVGLIIVIVGFSLLALGGHLTMRRLWYMHGWQKAEATIVGFESEWVECRTRSLVTRHRIYFCQYRIRDATGAEHEFTGTEGTPVLFPDTIGIRLPIRYHPNDPDRALVWEFWSVWLSPLGYLLGAISSFITAFWFG